MGARLEGLNKFYKTQILVSDAVRAAVGDHFLFRPIDRVLAKETATPTTIYELLSLKNSASAGVTGRYAAWTEAYRLYEARDWQGAHAIVEALAAADADDKVATHFRDRIAGVLSAPPADWDGVTRFDTK